MRRAGLAVLATVAVVVVVVLAAARPGTSAAERAAADLDRAFGGEPLVVAVRGDLVAEQLTPENLTRLLALERRIAGVPGVQRVDGPATYLDGRVAEARRLAADAVGKPGAPPGEVAARAEAARRGELGRTVGKRYADVLVRLGVTGFPSLADRRFVIANVLTESIRPGQRVRRLFPDAARLHIRVRPRAPVDGEARAALARRIDALVAGAGLAGRPAPAATPGDTARFAVRGHLADPRVLDWLWRAESRLPRAAPEVAPGPGMRELFGPAGPPRDRAVVRRVLAASEPAVLGGVLTPRRDLAEVSVVLPAGGEEARAEILRRVRATFETPPAGVRLEGP